MTRNIIDSRGKVCPGPVLDLFKVFRTAKNGEEVELLATDPAAVSDVKAWAGKNKSQVLEVANEAGHTKIVVRFRK